MSVLWPVSSAAEPRVKVMAPRTAAMELRVATGGGVTWHAAGLDEQDRLAGLLWRFHAGAPVLGGAAVGPDGTVYVASSDGYVHALAPGGAFKWSYTVTGSVLGGLSVDPAGHIHVGTTANRVYALTSGGRLWWRFHAPVSVVSDVVAGPGGVTVFVGADRHLWALSARAVALWRAPLSARLTAGPVLGARGRSVLLATADGRLTVIGAAAERTDILLSGSVEQAPVARADGTLFVIVSGALQALAPGGKPLWSRPGVAFVALFDEERVVAVERDGGLVVLGAAGQEQRRAQLGSVASAAPVVDAAGVVYVPTATGRLLVVPPDGPPSAVPVAHAPLSRPVLDAARGRLLVAAGDGTLCALRTWSTAGSSESLSSSGPLSPSERPSSLGLLPSPESSRSAEVGVPPLARVLPDQGRP